MDDLIVDHQLASSIIDDKCSDRTSSTAEGSLDLVIQTTLVDDLKALLHVTTLSHADDAAIIPHVQDTVLLVDWAEHALDHDRWLRVGDKAALFLKLTSEEIDTEISVLARLRRSADADDLARTALKDDKIANADEVAGDGDSVGSRRWTATLNETNALTVALADTGWS